MIKNKDEYKDYLLADKKALGRKKNSPAINDYIWRYEILLRKCEYYQNCKRGFLSSIIGGVIRYRRSILGAMCGFSIPVNCIDKGLCLAHIGSIIVSEYAHIGENCKIHVGVNIGADARISNAAPKIGNNVYIGPGAKLFGDIIIADNIAVGANAVVNKSFTEASISIGGIPAREISKNGSKEIIRNI